MHHGGYIWYHVIHILSFIKRVQFYSLHSNMTLNSYHTGFIANYLKGGWGILVSSLNCLSILRLNGAC